MKLTNKELEFFVDKIKLKAENMTKYRDQIKNLENNLKQKISNDTRTGAEGVTYGNIWFLEETYYT